MDTPRTSRKHKGFAQPSKRSPDQMADRAQMLKAVRELNDQGLSPKEISGKIGCCETRAYQLLMQCGRAKSAQAEAKMRAVRSEVRRLCREGMSSKEIADRTNICRSSVHVIVRKAGLVFVNRSRAEDRVRQMREIAAAGGSRSDAAKALGCTLQNIGQLAVRYGIAFPRKSGLGK